MLPDLPFLRAALVAGALVLTLTACGRRGAPEAPPDPSAPKAQQTTTESSDEDDTNDSVLPSPVGTPRKNPKRGFTIPKSQFILDPIL
ncbi:lipoprotein [Microvirga sp. 2MCAF38]|uniref:LptM family lipoprotein n=1 Tax=Microvirga sp. 2MCAF38 TaxID=3232989 RepID=UPI003F94B310